MVRPASTPELAMTVSACAEAGVAVVPRGVDTGLGQLRMDEARRDEAPVEPAMMAALRRTSDPMGLMNPGQIVPP